MKVNRVKVMAEIGLAVALSAILNFFPLFKMPQGGSVSLEMLPILIIAVRWGGIAGMISGLVYGLLQLVMGAYIVHPLQLILDYPLAYLLVGLAGFVALKDRISEEGLKRRGYYARLLLAVLIGGFARFVAHLISGVIFFGQYAPEGQNVWVYSAIYNGSFILPSVLIAFIVIIPLLKSLIRLKKT